MEMCTKNEMRRRLFAVAIFFGVSTATSQVAASQTEFIYSNDLPVVEMEFFNSGEFISSQNFNSAIINATKFGASYWRDILNLRASSKTPWQIALVSNYQPLIEGETFSFNYIMPTQDNYIAQMLQDRRKLVPFNLKSLANASTAGDVQAILQKNSTLDGNTAVSVVAVGNNLGANRNGAYRGWIVDENTILPTNEQAADLVGALRLEMAHALGAEAAIDSSAMKFSSDLRDSRAWTFHLVDANGNFATAGKQIVTSADLGELNPAEVFVANKVYFKGDNVSEVLNCATFNGVNGIPLNSTFNETLIPGLMSGLPYKNYSTFTELELAAMQDIGYNIDRKKFYGRSIYSSGGTFTNEDIFTSAEPLAVGLHVWGAKNDVTQSGDITLTGDGAVGVRVDGFENKVTIPQETTIQSDGLRGKGILISYGRDHNLNVEGNILATGNAVEFNFGSNMLGAGGEYRGSYLRYLRGVDASGNIISAENLSIFMTDSFNYSSNELNGALVNDFNLSGSLTGDNAIYIGKNSFVKNINFNKGANLRGNIISDWKHFTAEDGFLADYPIMIQYNGQTIDATKYIPDLVTNLNFNTSLEYGGNILGADNIKMNINAGTLKFSGAADVLSVDVGQGAKLFGGTFTLNNQSANLAAGFTDITTGKFINHGTIAAGTPDTNLVINGDLISDGVIQKISGGAAGSIIVNGNAYIDGSLVTTDSLLPNETETVLVANSITGNIKNPLGKPVPISGMLTATGAIVGNTLTVTTYESDNLGELKPQEKETFDAMGNMFENLENAGKQDEMRDLYNLAPDEAKKTLTQISSNDAAQIMSVAQQCTAVDKMISDRINRIFSPDHVEVNMHPMKFAEDEGEDHAPDMTVKVKLPSRQENNLWINYMKNWGSLRGGTDYHGSVIVGGYDRPIGEKWRAGIFATYGTIGYGVESSRATVYDTRIGAYAGYHNRASDVYFYVNGGQLRNSLHRGISSLGLATNANYKSHIVEIGGEYKYDLQPKKIWHVSPFVNFQTSYLRQNGYNESGAGIYNQHVEADNNTYFAAQAGLDLKRYYRSGMFGMRFGVKHGFTGVDPDLQVSYEGDSGHSYRLRNERDKTHFVFSVRGENEFANGWFVGGETELQFGENDRDVTASLMLRRMW